MLRRVVLSGCLLILAACAPSETLPPDQVLENAAHSAHALRSVRFDVSATMKGTSPLGKTTDVRLNAKGWTQREQQQMQLSGRLDGSVDLQPVTVDADIIVAGEQEVYVKVRNVSSTDPKSLLRSPFFSLILNQWWKLPSGDASATPALPVTPDPRILELQTQAVRVTKDRGMADVNGRLSYRYDLALDQEKMMHFLEEVARERKEPFDRAEWQKSFEGITMTGETWIDAENFQLNRLIWNAVSEREEAPWTLVFEISFTDHDKAPPIAPPTGAQELGSLGDMIPGLQPPGTLPPSMDSLTPEAQRQLLESLLNE